MGKSYPITFGQMKRKLNKNVFFAIEVCLYELNNKDIDLIIKSFEKVWKKILKR